MSKTLKLNRMRPKVSQETISRRAKPNWDWRDICKELKDLRKELAEHINQAASKTEDLRVKCYGKIYEMYIKCDDDDLEQLAELEKAVGKTEPREHLWNRMVKNLGVLKGQASKVVQVFVYARKKKVPATGFEDFVTEQGSLSDCYKQWKKANPKSSKQPKEKIRTLKLVGDGTRVRAITKSEGLFFATLTWDSENSVIRLEKIYHGEAWRIKKKRAKPEKHEDTDSLLGESAAEESDEEEEEEEGEEQTANLQEGWNNEHRRSIRLNDW